MAGVEITMLSMPGCPHVGLARRRLAQALRRVGVLAPIHEQMVESEADAARWGFVGSPTILVDGRDPFAGPSGVPGLACRLYPSAGGSQGAPSVEALTDALTAAYRSTRSGTSSLAVRLRWAAFDRLTGGRPVGAGVLADVLGADVEEVRAVIADGAGRGLVDVDGRGRVAGAHGLTLVPTDHELVLDGVMLHTWCALDAIGIPAALDADARATVRSGDDARVTVEVRGGKPTEPGGAVLWLPTGPCEDLRADFCAQANLFTTPAALRAWRREAGEPAGRVLTVSEAAALGRLWWSSRDPDGCCDAPFGG